MNPEIVTLFSFSGLTLSADVLNYAASGPVAQLVEQLTFNQWVTGSNPVGLTIISKGLAENAGPFVFLAAHRARQAITIFRGGLCIGM